ncbi:MAG: glycoside hydrolase, family 26 [Nocardioides sp.]|nr:glycoside hydrolase, family 26 [Nocardioides sp.]
MGVLLPAVAPASFAHPAAASSTCTPRIPLVDPAATEEARCLAVRLDGRQHRSGVGQQLNVSNSDYLRPLTLLEPDHVAVVGFDIGELAQGETYSFPDPPLQNLLRLAQEGAVLTASWHADNPHTERTAGDTSWHDLAALLDDTTPEARAYWADYDRMLALFLRLQTGDGGLYPPAAVVFRPFHEANGAWFWWGRPTPSVYRAVWARMQERAVAAGVHNILWAYSFAARAGSWIMHPAKLVPAHVDLAGIDSYDPEAGRGNGADRLDLRGYAEVAAKVARMTVTEAGPHGSARGLWDPAVITRTEKAARIRPLWSMLWFDDGTGADGVTGKKQISSLVGGPAWLHSCPDGLCSLS